MFCIVNYDKQTMSVKLNLIMTKKIAIKLNIKKDD